jgi:hypothetical protein
MSKPEQYTKDGNTYIIIPNIGIAELGRQKEFMLNSNLTAKKDNKKDTLSSKKYKIQSRKTRK